MGETFRPKIAMLLCLLQDDCSWYFETHPPLWVNTMHVNTIRTILDLFLIGTR